MTMQERLFALAAKIIRIISLKNVAIWTFAALVIVLGYTIFQNREGIISYIIKGPTTEAAPITTFAVSDVSKTRAKQLVDSDPLINGIVILNADIRNNRRVPLHWYSDDTTVQRSFDSLFNGRYGGIPLFTADEKNNESIVGVINGEFACGSYEVGGNATIFPTMVSALPFVCRASLPPYYGQFSGYIIITLNRVPSSDEVVALKGQAVNLSTEIYFRDVLSSNKKLTTPK
jgi:hypothetical protein